MECKLTQCAFAMLDLKETTADFAKRDITGKVVSLALIATLGNAMTDRKELENVCAPKDLIPTLIVWNVLLDFLEKIVTKSARNAIVEAAMMAFLVMENACVWQISTQKQTVVTVSMDSTV